MNFVNFNGTLLPAEEPIFTAQNRGFKYGDGVFETMKVISGEIQLSSLHFERLFISLQLLLINKNNLSQNLLENYILELCRLNNCVDRARVRLAVFRSLSNEPHFLLETTAIAPEINTWNEAGWKLGIYPFARKSVDAFANLKSANYLPYVLADLYAKEKNLEECLVLNCHDKIADGSKTNIFLIKKGELFTPALNSGCVNGVMRRFIIEEGKKNNLIVHQTEISVEKITEADEVFLTNALQGIRWVASFQNSEYENTMTRKIFDLLITKKYS